MNLKSFKDQLLFVPLGGSGEIGMNVNLYHLDGKWLMVDLGAGFADDYLPGVDMIVADIDFIKKRKKDLLGIVLTHAHEDHLGAVQYLWDELEVPVYATPFTTAFLKEKLADAGFKKGEVPIHELDEGARIEIGPFDIELVHITHSVPEMNAVFLRTRHGNVFHTGDWKLDPDPTLGPATNHDKLSALGDEGVMAMVSDSTNVFKDGVSGSEGDLRKSLVELISDCKQMVCVTTFASNVARVRNIIEAGHEAGRKVVLAGRSLERIVRAAKAAGYLQDLPQLLTPKEFNKHPRNKIMVMSTGCQGEPIAATNKIATGTHPDIRLKPKDTVIFSSKIIPGNEKRIFRLFNLFAKQKIEVLTEKDHFVHVSGHPNRGEMHEMYKMIRPKISVPVHGELVHMHEHARLAKEWGAEHAIETENGEIIHLNSKQPERVGMTDSSGYYGVDGNYLLPPDGTVLRMRRRVSREGVVIVSLVLDARFNLLTDPQIIAPGALCRKEDRDIIDSMVEDIRLNIEDSNRKTKKIGYNTIENVTRSAVRRVFKHEIGKNPPIEILVETIN